MGKRVKQKKKKLEVVFDTQKRKDFLTGFRKRKNERRKVAKEQVETLLKEERKRIKLEIKDGLKHMKKSFEPLKELTEEELNEKAEEYEDDDVKVKIVELSAHDIASQRNFLGQNQHESDESENEENEAMSEDEEEKQANFIPGMSLVAKKKPKKEKAKSEKTTKPIDPLTAPKCKKDVDKIMKKKTMKNLKKSNVFKLKQKFEQVANRKKSRRDQRNTTKSLPKHKQKDKKRFNNDMNRKPRKGRGGLKQQ